MNAAFLLVTSAWLAGGDAPPAAPPAPPAAVTTAPVVSSAPSAGCAGGGCGGCSSCDSGCGCGCEEHEGLFAKLKAKFARGGCGCEAAPSCGCEAAPSCGCEEKEGFLSRLKNKCKGWGSSSCGCGCETKVEHSCGCAASSCGCEDSGPSFFERLKAKFHHSSECGCESGCSSCGGSSYSGSSYSGSSYGAPVGAPVTSPPMPPAGEPVKPPKDLDPGKKLPEGGKEKEAKAPAAFEVAPASATTTEQETHNPFELDRRYQARIDRAADYSWLTGQLFFVHADGGLWVLRYASLSTEDINGGGVILARDLPMDSYHEGDLVKIHGEILNQKGSLYLGAPLYRATTIELVERAQP